MIIYNCFVSKNYKKLQQGRSSIFLMGGREPHPRRKNLRNSKLGMETRNYSLKSWYEALTPNKLGVLKDSVSHELWLPKSAELVEDTLTFLVSWNCQKCLFGKRWVNYKKMPGKMKIMYLNLYKLTLSQLSFDGFWE